MAKVKKKKKKAKEPRTRLIPPGEAMPEDDEMEDGERGVYLEKEDVQVIYNALKQYKPTTAKEEQLLDIWLEEFDMMLVVDYGRPMYED
jgi:hypothetical protein